MDDISTASLILLAVFFLLSAFFSGSEAALLSVQRVRIQQMVNAKVAGAARVARLVERPDKLLPPILIGNNVVNTAAAALATAIATTLIADEGQAVIAATAVVTVILLIFGEITPKSVAATYPERVAIIVGAPIRWLMVLLTPASFLLQAFSTAVVRLFGGAGARSVTPEEIKALVYIGRESGAVEQEEAEIIRRVLDFGDRRVREVMTPRPEIIWVEAGTTIGDFLKLYNEHYHTRFPVYYGNVDNVIGLVSVKDVVRMLASGAQLTDSVTSYVRPVVFVPETKRVQELLDEMRTSGAQLAMVADEFGGVAGLVTLKRLIEGIVGRSAEEDLEEPEAEVIHLGDNTFEVDGGLSILDANERLGLDIPVGEYETIAGFLLEELGKVPEPGEKLEYGPLTFTVGEMKGMRIARVQITRGIDAESPPDR